MGRAATVESAALFFYELTSYAILLAFLLVSAVVDDENRLKFRWLCHYAVIGHGHHGKYYNNNNDLSRWFDSGFLGTVVAMH